MAGSAVLLTSGTLRTLGRNVLGSVWNMISLLLTTDDVVMLRAAARPWNVVDRFGRWESFSWLLKMEQSEKTWHYDEQGRRTYTMLRLRNPIMDSIRRCGLHPPSEETPPDGQGTVNMASFGDTLIALSGNQPAEAQLYQSDKNWAYPGYDDDNASISSGSLSPDLGHIWKYGCTRCPDLDRESIGELDDGATEKEGGEYDVWNVLEGPLWYVHDRRKAEYGRVVRDPLLKFTFC